MCSNLLTRRVFIFKVSKKWPFVTPPTKVHETPSRLTSACTDSIRLLFASPALQISSGILLFCQHMPSKANPERSLSWIQSRDQLRSCINTDTKNGIVPAAAFPPLSRMYITVPSQFSCCRHIKLRINILIGSVTADFWMFRWACTAQRRNKRCKCS